jgi:hypothetical protein
MAELFVTAGAALLVQARADTSDICPLSLAPSLPLSLSVIDSSSEAAHNSQALRARAGECASGGVAGDTGKTQFGGSGLGGEGGRKEEGEGGGKEEEWVGDGVEHRRRFVELPQGNELRAGAKVEALEEAVFLLTCGLTAMRTCNGPHSFATQRASAVLEKVANESERLTERDGVEEGRDREGGRD